MIELIQDLHEYLMKKKRHPAYICIQEFEICFIGKVNWFTVTLCMFQKLPMGQCDVVL